MFEDKITAFNNLVFYSKSTSYINTYGYMGGTYSYILILNK